MEITELGYLNGSQALFWNIKIGRVAQALCALCGSWCIRFFDLNIP